MGTMCYIENKKTNQNITSPMLCPKKSTFKYLVV